MHGAEVRDATPIGPRPQKILRATLIARMAATLLALGFALAQLAAWPARLRYPGELDLVEGMPLAEMVHLRQGRPIYAPASIHGYDAANFGPLYYVLGAHLIDPQQPAYFPLRVLSIFGTLGCAAGCGLMSFWLSRKYLAALLASLLFLSFAFVTRHGTSARPDAAALSLMFAGFLVAYHFRGRAAMLWAAPLMMLGFYYKQQFVAAPLAILIYLFIEKRYRLAAEFAGLMILGGLALLAHFQFVLFSGQDFFLHFVTYNVLLFAKFNLLAGLAFFGLVLFLPSLVGLEFVRVSGDKLLGCYLICAIVLSLLTVARSGSDSYYFLEPALITSCLFGALFATRATDPASSRELLALLAVTVFLGQWGGGQSPSPGAFQQDRAVQDYLRQRFAPGTPALSYYVGDMVRAGLSTPVTNVYHYSFLIRKRTLSDRDLIRQIEDHSFGVVAVGFDLQSEEGTIWADHYLTRSVRDAIRSEYQLVDRLKMPRPERVREPGWLYFWIPKTGSRTDERVVRP